MVIHTFFAKEVPKNYVSLVIGSLEDFISIKELNSWRIAAYLAEDFKCQ